MKKLFLKYKYLAIYIMYSTNILALETNSSSDIIVPINLTLLKNIYTDIQISHIKKLIEKYFLKEISYEDIFNKLSTINNNELKLIKEYVEKNHTPFYDSEDVYHILIKLIDEKIESNIPTISIIPK